MSGMDINSEEILAPKDIVVENIASSEMNPNCMISTSTFKYPFHVLLINVTHALSIGRFQKRKWLRFVAYGATYGLASQFRLSVKFFFTASSLEDHFVSMLNAEAIANGVIANISSFPYQAAIFGTVNRNTMSILLCSGVILSSLWILSVSHCFMLNSERVKPLIFIAVVGFNDVATEGSVIEQIDYIYTDRYNNLYYKNDLTMAKTAKAITLSDTVNVIVIPYPGVLYLDKYGVVSGYGCSKIESEADEDDNNIFIPLDSDLKLRYTNVTFSSSRDCINEFPITDACDKFCGVAIHIEGEYTGMCSNDEGSPLVIDNEVVGLSSRTYEDCDDTIDGSMYIMVADYFHFIYDILMGTPKASYKSHFIRPR